MAKKSLGVEVKKAKKDKGEKISSTTKISKMKIKRMAR